MLSIDECRKLIDGDEKYTDKEIEEIRDTLYGLADLAFDVWLERKKKAKMKIMNVKLGTLSISPANLRLDLLAEPVQKAVATLPNIEGVGVTEIDPNLSDTAAFCEHYQVGMDQAANCVVLEAKRADKTWFAACVVLGSTRADVNGLARRTLDARKVSFAPMEKAVAETGMEYGAITPVGLPASWSILVDKAVADSEYVIIGSGIRKSKLAVPGNFLASLPNAQVLERLGTVKENS